ncbi:BolA/IbaG family iron-sulfur metabolism protein [Candidatus Enterovibrio altilux]|uniref:DNA-binding transcriptional regulator BolA n=1 Tax=Candidatus Enterovibrio altilux TaxID=1927128 RepID=A0A291B6G5_9GAMM|nr:BolA/IbaG family iron-sulfur metabolism protein [Candidatus Enterovibrio luxaltus]ATF08590.1 Cell division protein BolA [Candidatus Enterovibrio luxaltus]
MIIQQKIQQKLTVAFSPIFLDVVNESHMHNVPVGSESHFKVTVVAITFEGKHILARHRAVNRALKDELQHGLYALIIHTYTEREWNDLSDQFSVSPPCHGGATFENDIG